MNEIMRMGDYSDTTPVLIPTVEQPIEMSVSDVLRWIAPTAPPNEAMKFLMTCRMAQVNPFLGEAHLVDHGGRFTTIIDKSGYLKRAQSHPDYQGHEAGIIAQEFDPVSKVRGPMLDLIGSFLPPGYIVVGGWAKVYRKNVRKPIEIRVSVQEYNRGQGTWKTLTCTMIRKVALVQALRESGLISSGWYAPGETPNSEKNANWPGADEDFEVTAGEVAAEYDFAVDSSLSAELAARIVGLMNALEMTDDQRLAALRRRGVSHIAELNNVQASEMISRLQYVMDQRKLGEFLLPDPKPALEDAAPTTTKAEPEEAATTDADSDVIDVTDTVTEAEAKTEAEAEDNAKASNAESESEPESVNASA